MRRAAEEGEKRGCGDERTESGTVDGPWDRMCLFHGTLRTKQFYNVVQSYRSYAQATLT